jgi:nucleotide-binding universal stress UspA family protein
MTSAATHVQPLVALDRIFHPTDFSAASDVAFAHALKLATHCEGKLTMLHTEAEASAIHWSEFPSVRRTLERWGFLPRGSNKEALAELGLCVAKVTTRERNPVTGTLDYLAKHPHDLIVLATHQYDGLERLLHRTVAEPLARRAGALTLFVPEGIDGFVSIESGAVNLRHVLIPVTHEPDPQVAVEVASLLAASLSNLRVDFSLLHIGARADFPDVSIPGGARGRWRKLIKQGNVVEVILQTARECRADLIVMATAGEQGFLDALRGSTTERIVRQAEVPVLAVPASARVPEQRDEAFIWSPGI